MAAMEAKKSKERDAKPAAAAVGRGRGAPTKEVSRAPGGGGGHKGISDCCSSVHNFFTKNYINCRLGARTGEKSVNCTFGPSQETRPVACSGIHFFAKSLRSEFIFAHFG